MSNSADSPEAGSGGSSGPGSGTVESDGSSSPATGDASARGGVRPVRVLTVGVFALAGLIFFTSFDTAKGTKKVKCDGNPVCVKDSNFKMSTGDEAGSAGGGMLSSKIKGKAEFLMGSFDVKFEGKDVCRAFDIMLHNDKNTPPFPVLQGPVVAMPADPEPKCLICDKAL